MDLVAGYESYATVEDVDVVAFGEAPASSPACFSYFTSALSVTGTIAITC
ncbi:LxmA leader domain family RiPP [Nocardiopsis sp. CC223A]|nr:LxmA leader domain family RiPP [Nocardiopsis sp. CC223A]